MMFQINGVYGHTILRIRLFILSSSRFLILLMMWLFSFVFMLFPFLSTVRATIQESDLLHLRLDS